VYCVQILAMGFQMCQPQQFARDLDSLGGLIRAAERANAISLHSELDLDGGFQFVRPVERRVRN
jgi:hypothetical protein